MSMSIPSRRVIEQQTNQTTPIRPASVCQDHRVLFSTHQSHSIGVHSLTALFLQRFQHPDGFTVLPPPLGLTRLTT